MQYKELFFIFLSNDGFSYEGGIRSISNGVKLSLT
jgi:hypothetical protein